MKTPEQVLADVRRRLTRTWASVVWAEVCAAGAAPDHGTAGSAMPGETESAWVGEFPLGQPTGAELASGYAAYFEQVRVWREWVAQRQVRVRSGVRRVHGTSQELPTHLLVPDIDTAARLCGGDWPARLLRARARAAVLAERHRHLGAPARTLAAVDALSELDFELLCRAADWFAAHDASGLTPRQVPIGGLHAKWLNSRQGLVRELAGKDDLGLLPPHPPRVHFTYLDPGHRAAGGRLHDSATVGDRVVLPYDPQVVVISENKDTALHFPPLPGGVSIEGQGRGGGAIASFDWVTSAPVVVYWGDMDADGLEILDEFRAAGVPAVSVLMDLGAYRRWEPFGTDHDVKGRPLGSRAPKPVPHLLEHERDLYQLLVSPDCVTHRRVEQERIPLDVALEQVMSACGSSRLTQQQWR